MKKCSSWPWTKAQQYWHEVARNINLANRGDPVG